MANAQDIVRQNANFITASNEEDGVAAGKGSDRHDGGFCGRLLFLLSLQPGDHAGKNTQLMGFFQKTVNKPWKNPK